MLTPPPLLPPLACIRFYYPELLGEQWRGSDFDYFCLPGSSRNSSAHVAAGASGLFYPAGLPCMRTWPFICKPNVILEKLAKKNKTPKKQNVSRREGWTEWERQRWGLSLSACMPPCQR